MTTAPKADILVVDDTAAYLEALRAMLQEQGFRVRPVPSGRLALGAIEQRAPDLVLLDINMPEMDGFETCRRLKADPRFADLPVIFLSSLSETDDKVKAFAAGGVDYITKPFQAAEVLARVETHLRLRRLQAQLALQLQDLQTLESMRDSLTHMIVHDLRSPLQGILASLELLQDSAAGKGADGEAQVTMGLQATQTLIQMISTLLDVNKMEAGEMPVTRAEADLASAVTDALQRLGALVKDRDIVVERAESPLTARFDRDIVARVVVNLIANALRFTPESGRIIVRIGRRGARASIAVVDTGPGIPAEHHARIFEKFGQVGVGGGKRYGTGLGLAFCKLAVAAHGGEIGVNSVVGKGSEFWFTVD